MKLIILLLSAVYLAGCSFGAAAPFMVAGLSATEYGRFKSELRDRAEACQASEEDLLPQSVTAITRDKALDIIPVYLSVYENDEFSDDMQAEALYQVGLIYMNEYNRDRDDQKALIYFEKLKVEFPSSALCADVDVQIATIQHRREQAISFDADTLSAYRSAIQQRADTCIAEDGALMPIAVDAISKKQAFKAVKYFNAISEDDSLPLYEREQALFQIGLIYMNQSNIHRDDQRALDYFNKLQQTFPDSLYCVDAQARIDEIHQRVASKE